MNNYLSHCQDHNSSTKNYNSSTSTGQEVSNLFPETYFMGCLPSLSHPVQASAVTSQTYSTKSAACTNNFSAPSQPSTSHTHTSDEANKDNSSTLSGPSLVVQNLKIMTHIRSLRKQVLGAQVFGLNFL